MCHTGWLIDEAVYLALECGVTICTFGDLVRVPGTEMSLAGAREKGAKVRIVYSPVDAEQYAKDHPEEQVVFWLLVLRQRHRPAVWL